MTLVSTTCYPRKPGREPIANAANSYASKEMIFANRRQFWRCDPRHNVGVNFGLAFIAVKRSTRQ